MILLNSKTDLSMFKLKIYPQV